MDNNKNVSFETDKPFSVTIVTNLATHTWTSLADGWVEYKCFTLSTSERILRVTMTRQKALEEIAFVALQALRA